MTELTIRLNESGAASLLTELTAKQVLDLMTEDATGDDYEFMIEIPHTLGTAYIYPSSIVLINEHSDDDETFSRMLEGVITEGNA